VLHAVVRDLALSWAEYAALVAARDGEVPDGLVIRAAGRTAEGVRVIEVWTSVQSADSDTSAFDAAAPAATPPLCEPVVRTFAVEHLAHGGNEASRRAVEPSRAQNEPA